MRGRFLADTIVPRRFRDAHQRGLARYLAIGEAHVLGRRIEVTALRTDGTEFPIELAITRVPDCTFTGMLPIGGRRD